MNTISPRVASDLASLVYDIKTPDAQGFFRMRPSASTKLFEFDLSNGPVRGVTGGGPFGLFNKTTGFALIGKGKQNYSNHIAIAIRGTKSGNDWLSNFNIGYAGSDTGSTVHAGFNKSFQSMKPAFERVLSTTVKANTTIHCVGHSLGGALASLTADWIKLRYKCSVNLYTFGAPRVGLIPFANKHTGSIDNIYRCTHGADPVPMIPLWPFCHAPVRGVEYRLDRSQGINIDAHGMHVNGNPGYANTANSDDWSSLGYRANENFKAVNLRYPDRYQASFTTYWAERISDALITLLKNVGKLPVIAMQATIGTSLTFYDLLAQTLEEVAKASDRFADQVKGLLGHMLVFARQAITTVTDLSYQFIRWVFEKTLQALYRAARNAIDSVS